MTQTSEGATEYQRILILLDEEQWAEAERSLENFVLTYPDYAGPHVNLGMLYARSDRLDDAERALERALELNPGNAVAYNQLGILYRRLGRFAEADDAYQRALSAAPDYAEAHLNRGILNDLFLQEPAVALVHYERYLALSGGADSRVSGWIAEIRRRIGAADPPAADGISE